MSWASFWQRVVTLVLRRTPAAPVADVAGAVAGELVSELHDEPTAPEGKPLPWTSVAEIKRQSDAGATLYRVPPPRPKRKP